MAPGDTRIGHGARRTAGNLLREHVALDVRGDGGENQVLEFGRLQRLHLPLHSAARQPQRGVKAGQLGLVRPILRGARW
ncbi:hypothetical protein [Streptomyces sp. NPDC048350]|uniref:hypothetical protein n=1 Tax=Streptomyces sp. NPDC048350 TaxID=3365538 RepID=UPI00371A6106